MHITLVDDSIPFDGFTAQNRPLGGAEKAFASLVGALSRRGHQVHAFNRARFPLVVENARWEVLGGTVPLPTQTDVLIAFRKPALLPMVRLAGTRILWVTATARQMAPSRRAISSFEPNLVLVGKRQAADFDLPRQKVIVPGLRPDFLEDAPTILAVPPTAVVTTHPAHGLDWLLDLWGSRIHPRLGEAHLVVVSAALAKGDGGAELAPEMAALLAKARATPGVRIVAPKPDPGMATLYRSARVHLYPGHADDMGCWTLMESQACGLPAVVRDKGAAAERIVQGQTGQVAPDDEAFANLAVGLLSNDELFWSMNRDARLMQAARSWDVVAAEFETVFGKKP